MAEAAVSALNDEPQPTLSKGNAKKHLQKFSMLLDKYHNAVLEQMVVDPSDKLRTRVASAEAWVARRKVKAAYLQALTNRVLFEAAARKTQEKRWRKWKKQESPQLNPYKKAVEKAQRAQVKRWREWKEQGSP